MSAKAFWRSSPRRPRPGSRTATNRSTRLFDEVESRFVEAWQNDAGLQTYGEAVADLLEFREREGEPQEMSAADWRKFAERASLYEAREKAKELGADAGWDCERVKTPEGYYQLRGGIPYAIAKSLAAAPFADILWMETKTADLDDARSSPTRSTPSIPTRCWPTTCPPRSTGTPPA